ncbi:MAG: rhomboid family intramembrane serine protease, partial [Nannocystaceae bacterium]
NLVELGAMIGPLSLLDGEYWRLLTAGFLHFGWLHLGLNAAGIFFFGRLLEQAIGAIRFGLLYVVASVGAMGILLAVNELTSGEPFLIVGASASLMGIVGALLAVSLKRLWQRRDRGLLRPILSLLAVIGIQTLFDLTTPQVSMGAHLGGAGLGFLFALLLTPLRQPGAPNA